VTRVISFATGHNQGSGHLFTLTMTTTVTFVIRMLKLQMVDFTLVCMQILIATLIAARNATTQKLLPMKSPKTVNRRASKLNVKILSIWTPCSLRFYAKLKANTSKPQFY
jgi:hypothetical protein